MTMRVEQLIEALQQLPQHAPVFLRLDRVAMPSVELCCSGASHLELGPDDEREVGYVRYEGNYVLIRP